MLILLVCSNLRQIWGLQNSVLRKRNTLFYAVFSWSFVANGQLSPNI
jgi:hypothetical protein